MTAGYVGAYNVYDDGYTVGSTARCSCGVGHYGYTTSYFVDMCPNCGGNLYFEQGAYSGPAYTSPEGLWACSVCDMDRKSGIINPIPQNFAHSAVKAMTIEDTG